MDKKCEQALLFVDKTLTEAEKYSHAAKVISYDQETICPPKAIQEEGEIASSLSSQAYRLVKDPEFIRQAEILYASEESLSPLDKALAESMHRSYLRTKNVTPEMESEFSLAFNSSFVAWLSAKKASDFSLFAPSLMKVIGIDKKLAALSEDRKPTPYDSLLDVYERGMTCADLDIIFAKTAERLTPLLGRILRSPKKVRTDFLSRPVPIEKQRQFTDYLLEVIGFDFSRGAVTTTEHPFTNELGRNDVRITTHYYEDNFISNMFSVIHEGGHAIFGQNQRPEDYRHHLEDSMSMGMHESVSRFYENRIGRSRAFISLIFPKFKELFGDIFSDVSEEELYEGVNAVAPSLIRTEADELTYSFHIIIRYELEKEIINGAADVASLPGKWNALYGKYLGIVPDCDRNGILQDVHWSSGFGYFPTYALGNFYNAMYFKVMDHDLDIGKTVAAGRFDLIRQWMAEHVFAEANVLDSKEWLKRITGLEPSPDAFLDYLEEKYSDIYDL